MTPPQPLSFGALLKRLRRARSWTQAQLAEKSDFSTIYISMLERGIRRPTSDAFKSLAKALELDTEQNATFLATARLQGYKDALDDASRAVISMLSQDASIHTFLIATVRGSTRFTLEYGDEATARLAARFAQVARETVENRAGRVFELRGTEALAIFASARQALHAAVELQARCAAATAADPTLPLSIGIGLDAGEAVPVADSFHGAALVVAERLCTVAGPGEVLASNTVIHLARAIPGMVYCNRRAISLSQSAEPVHVMRVLTDDEAPVEASGDGWDAVLRGTGDNNLPIQLTSFVGRTREVAEVKDLLATARLLTLTGAGGTGKTRLALQVAAEVSEAFPDGVFFVNLAPLSDPELVLSAIAQVLEVRETSERSLLDRLHAALRDKHLLLVLDNFEQVVQAAVPVAELLAACPKLKILVTSRMALHVRAEREFAVPPLALPDYKHLPDLVALSQYEAVALFIQQAQAVKPDFAVTNATAPAIAEICVRLDGLPLAIELAAARIKVFPPEALLARLGQRLVVLTGGARDVPARQQTLRATIAWSYHLLDAQEQQLFRQLCVFVGGCSLDAVEAVCAVLGTDESPIVIDLLAALIDKSLLQQTEQEGKQSRFVLLETIREYGLEALATSAELEATRQAHAEYFLHLAEQAEPELVGPQAAAWLERLNREQDNLRATMQWSLEPAQTGRDPELALRLGQALAVFWKVRGPYREGLVFLEQALTANQEGATVLRARVLRSAADFSNLLDDVDRAEVLCQESLALSRTLGDTRGISSGLALLAYIARNNGSHYRLVRSLAEESLALARELGEKEIIAERLVDLADPLCVLGDYHEGQRLFEESLALFRELGNKRGLAHCLRTSALHLIADQGDPKTIHDRLEESLTLCMESGDKIGLCHYSLYAGYAALVEGDPMTARVLAEQSLVLSREIGSRWESMFAIAILARIAARQEDYAAAQALHEESLREVGAFKDHDVIAYCLEALAETMAAEGAATWATQLWGTAEVEREHCGLPMFPVDRRDYEATVAHVRLQLGEAAFDAAWSEGRSLTPAEVAARGSSVSLVGSPAPLSTEVPDTPSFG